MDASKIPSSACTSDVLDEQTEAGYHILRECPEPRNHAKQALKVQRYHENKQKFGHIKPGQISPETLNALGCAPGELPFFYYRLRVLGYPPAWLEAAKVQSSGLNLYNADGTKVENGESDTFKYDINKIVEFPGFNVRPTGFDDFQRHNVPPFQPEQSKENFIKSLGGNVTSGYGRNKLVDLPAPHDGPILPASREKQLRQLTALDDTAEVEEKPEAVGATDIKASVKGTPVLKTENVFDKLPDISNFQVGISDVIMFENLPGSTGKYEQIRDVLKNAREKTQSED